ncbi:MAG TPA: TonB-dependent receptor [Vicinamibacteria bacterium]|nr:TonB-dependent receptor [Vicinamibacteria bacterium]
MSRILRPALAAALALLATAPSWAQTTGRITGTVQDAQGGAMPGVVVTVSSSALQGVRSMTTAATGEFRFLALPPGTYTLKAEMSGFKTYEQTGVVVGVDRTVELAVKLTVATVAETVEVSGESPVIDTTNTTTGISATADLFTRIPLQRTFDDVARVAPGTQQDATGMVVYGSSGAENQYIIEGLNTTGARSGTLTKNLNFDFVDEVEVKTGGMPAEYGRLTGGALNVLTKSGSNNFHGSVFGFFEGKGLASNDNTAADRPAWQTTTQKLDQKYDFGASLGGYIVKDTLWFFGAYNRVNQTDNTTVIRTLTAPGAPALGSVIPGTTKTDLFSGKLTWKIAPNHTLTGSVFGDPGTFDGPWLAIQGPESTWKSLVDQGGTDYVARYDGVFSNSLMVRGQYGHHQEKSIPGGPGRDMPAMIDQTVVPTEQTGGFAYFEDERYTRDQARADVSKFLGNHEIKLGGDWYKVDSQVGRFMGGAGQRIYKLPNDPTTGGIYYRHRYYVDDLAGGYNRSDPSTWVIADPLAVSPSSQGLSAYLQDSWKVVKNFTLNVGVRWEQQEVGNREGQTAFKISDNWAPRIGFVWDVKGDGKSKAYFHYGRYYEDIPQDINIRAFGGEITAFSYNYSPDPADYLPDPAARRSTLLGAPVEPVDPNLKGQFINEYLGGYEQEIVPNFSLGVKATYRNLGRVIEDFLVPAEGNYFIANPGEGTLGQTLAFYDQVHTAPAPKAERKELAFEVDARKRFSNNWQFLASYVWERLEGNYDGTFQNSTGQLDPNINSAFDYADFLVNANGRLSAERQNQFKFDGSYQFSKGPLNGLNLGLSTYWYSGLPLTAYGYSLAYANWEYYLTPRGSLGRGPSDWEANLHVNYPIKLDQRGTKLDLVMDIFNLFNRQSAIHLDERYNLVADGACAGIPANLCNGDGGLATGGNTLTPLGQLSDPRSTATNPDFLKKGIDFTLPRDIRFGVRLTF